MNNTLDNFSLDLNFSSSVYKCNRKEFIPVIKPVFEEYIAKSKDLNDLFDIFPINQTDTFVLDERISEFSHYIANISWDILGSQGYKTELYLTQVVELWGQSHSKTSSMEYHTHESTVLSGFFFIDVPANSSDLVFHDPRSAKVHSNLIEKNRADLTLASNSVFYKPEPGDIIITNSWLPHSITRNKSNEMLNLLHFNINVVPRPEEHAIVV